MGAAALLNFSYVPPHIFPPGRITVAFWRPAARRSAEAKTSKLERRIPAYTGKHCFCETRGPSLCHASRWCTQNAMQTLRPDIFGEYHCCNDIPLERVAEMQEAWRRNASASRPPGQLLHRVRGKLGRLSVGR